MYSMYQSFCCVSFHLSIWTVLFVRRRPPLSWSRWRRGVGCRQTAWRTTKRVPSHRCCTGQGATERRSQRPRDDYRENPVQRRNDGSGKSRNKETKSKLKCNVEMQKLETCEIWIRRLIAYYLHTYQILVAIEFFSSFKTQNPWNNGIVIMFALRNRKGPFALDDSDTF